jgi:hypothetical protein
MDVVESAVTSAFAEVERSEELMTQHVAKATVGQAAVTTAVILMIRDMNDVGRKRSYRAMILTASSTSSLLHAHTSHNTNDRALVVPV